MNDARRHDDSTGSAALAVGEAVEQAEEAEAEVTTDLVGRYRHHPVVRAAGTLSEIADQPQLFTICAAVTAWGLASGDRRLALCGGHMLASFLLATWTKTALKKLVVRTRPNMLTDRGVHETGLLGPDEGPWNSFPSGHTAGSLAVARAVARRYPSAGRAAYGWAASVAIAQIPRCAHYPSDVAAGAVIGLAAEAAAHRLMAAAVPSYGATGSSAQTAPSASSVSR
jgi:membrane-associated phospholipid phosphatase